MKQMTCAQIGGPATCSTVLSGNTAEEMITKDGMPHVMSEHPEMAEDIKKMSAEETTQWMENFQKQFDAAPAVNS
jgi:hypothetical protein